MSQNARITTHPVAPLFVNRWSPRAFSGEPISQAELLSLFEAARWAPSANNSQPWRFIYVLNGAPEWANVHGLLNENNQRWSAKAAALVVLAVNVGLLVWLRFYYFVLFFVVYIAFTLALNLAWRAGWRGIAPPQTYPDE